MGLGNTVVPFETIIELLEGKYSSLLIETQIGINLKARELRKTGGIKVDKEEKKWGSDEPVV